MVLQHGMTSLRSELRNHVRPSGLAIVAAIGALAGLVVVWMDYDRLHSGELTFHLPLPPTWALYALALGIAIVNGIGEELLWRGVIGSLLAGAPLFIQFAVQAVTFGIAHWYGIPNGPVGVVAASLYSIVVFQVWRRHGLLASTILHIATDTVVFVVVVRHASYVSF